jgi:acetyltransferase-like isoleucine patch superfamily enzyme
MLNTLKRLKKILFKSELEIHYKENFRCGKNVFIGSGVFYCQGGLTLDNHIIIANDLLVLTSEHCFEECDSFPFNNKIKLLPVHIKRGVWIGSRVTILPGVVIGEHCIVGANSVVTKSLEPFGIYAGNPARLIKFRDSSELSKMEDIDFVYQKYGHSKKFIK